ncbi:hypothetical protein GCM10022243_47110 [Saccharothrix violaceirubra]|uniref:Uncharacterized protein n=1 Tax=Saccharothrix violaceirubra TaxID=413306 RepID=A0A7W7T705_9PSEU|nr:Imm1 family immunity protein [Saccharothrix violaceirubra]MBB4967748.1 hypothetical protein [Saccharothrix violaceirubra]
MVTLSAVFDRESAVDPILVRTQDELGALIERVRTAATGLPCPPIVTIGEADDPWGSPILEAGIGEDRGFVRETWNPMRVTRGDLSATGVLVYDFQAHPADIPADQAVSLDVVREVLAAYLAHDTRIPADFPHLHIVS